VTQILAFCEATVAVSSFEDLLALAAAMSCDKRSVSSRLAWTASFRLYSHGGLSVIMSQCDSIGSGALDSKCQTGHLMSHRPGVP